MTSKSADLKLVTFKKDIIDTNKRDGSPIQIIKRTPISMLDMYAKVQYVASKLDSDAVIKLIFEGSANMKLGLDFINALKRAGVKLIETKIIFNMTKFRDEEAEHEVMQMNALISDVGSVKLDQLVFLSRGFLAQCDEILD